MRSRWRPSPRRLAWAVGLLLAWPAWASAVDQDPPPTSAADAVERIREHDRRTETRVVGVGRIRLSHPQRLSASLGAMVVKQPADFHCTTVCDFKGLLLQAEPGIGGGQLSAGYAVLLAEKRRSPFLLAEAYMGYGIKGALLRTWNNANLDPPDQTLIGVEGEFTIIQVNFSLGLFRHLSGGDPDDRWQISGGVGWGF